MPRFFPNKLRDFNPNSDSDVSKDANDAVGEISSMINEICSNVRSMGLDGGLYVGNAGVAYMLWYAANHPSFATVKDQYLNFALSIYEMNVDIKNNYQSRKASDTTSFILGKAGIYLLGALIGRSLRKEEMVVENAHKYRALAENCIKPNVVGDELFVGRAGYLCGVMNFEKKLGVKVIDDKTKNAICAAMFDSGRKYSTRHRSTIYLMYAYYDTEYLGAAHGLSSILQMMISCPSFLASDPQMNVDLQRCVDSLLNTQLPNGNFVPSTDELKSYNQRPVEEELVHWCHGAPGTIYLLAKAYKVWGDERYLAACRKCGEVTWQKGLLKKGPGICHGVAGSGYVFLVLYQLTGEKIHLHRAQQFARFMQTEEFQRGARRPDNPYSLYEGTAGTVCFLIDLLQPKKAEFPFFVLD